MAYAIYLHAPEEVPAGLDLVAMVIEVLASGLDLGTLLGGASLRFELPNLPPDVVVGAIQVGAVFSFRNLQPPHSDLLFSSLPSTGYTATLCVRVYSPS